MATNTELLNKARKAHRNRQQNAPRLLLDAIDHRIREIDPDGDPWAAAQRIAKAVNFTGIEAAYYGAMLFERDARETGRYHSDDWTMNYDIAKMLLDRLDREFA